MAISLVSIVYTFSESGSATLRKNKFPLAFEGEGDKGGEVDAMYGTRVDFSWLKIFAKLFVTHNEKIYQNHIGRNASGGNEPADAVPRRLRILPDLREYSTELYA
jgi:hypothetical protein